MIDSHIRPLLRLDRTVRFVDEVFRIAEGASPIEPAASLLHDAETKNALEMTTIIPFPSLRELPDHLYPDYVEGRFFDFLSETNLILGASEASRLSVLFSEGFIYQWGVREWGHILAKWSNERKWLGYDSWRFSDFTAGPSDVTIESYNIWSETAMRVIKLKCRNRTESAQQSIPELTQHLLNNPDSSIRQNAAATLGGIGTSEAKSALQAGFETENDERVLGDIRFYLSLSDLAM